MIMLQLTGWHSYDNYRYCHNKWGPISSRSDDNYPYCYNHLVLINRVCCTNYCHRETTLLTSLLFAVFLVLPAPHRNLYICPLSPIITPTAAAISVGEMFTSPAISVILIRRNIAIPLKISRNNNFHFDHI